MHVHVGLLGDQHPQLGRMSAWYTKQLTYRVFLFYGRLRHDQVSDRALRKATIRTITESKMDRVVCLALDPVYDAAGVRREDRSNVWVDNEYVLNLCREAGDRILLGASVHPFAADFQARVKKYVDQLLKWLPWPCRLTWQIPKSAAQELLATKLEPR